VWGVARGAPALFDPALFDLSRPFCVVDTPARRGVRFMALGTGVTPTGSSDFFTRRPRSGASSNECVGSGMRVVGLDGLGLSTHVLDYRILDLPNRNAAV